MSSWNSHRIFRFCHYLDVKSVILAFAFMQDLGDRWPMKKGRRSCRGQAENYFFVYSRWQHSKFSHLLLICNRTLHTDLDCCCCKMRKQRKSNVLHTPRWEEKRICCCCKIRGKVHMRKTILLLLHKENLKGAHEKKSVPASRWGNFCTFFFYWCSAQNHLKKKEFEKY
jgi:hypothetical protein